MVKNLPANAGDTGSIPGSGRSPGGGHSNPVHYTCLGNPMNREAWQATVYGVAKSWIQLSDRTYTHILSLLLYQTHTPPLGSRGPLSSPTSPPYPSQLPQVSPVVYFRHFRSVLRYSGHTYTYYRLQSRWDLAMQDRLSLSPWPLP